MQWKRITYEKLENIVKITMNRPEARNAQDDLMLDEMEKAFREADQDEEVRVIVLAGAGRSFSAGHDLSGRGLPAEGVKPFIILETTLEEATKREQRIYYNQALTIRNVSKPTIAQVQGHCIAGGLIVACMCDIIVASENASFSNPVVRMAINGVEVLFEPWELGIRKAKEFLFTGDPMDAKEAWRLGLVNRVVPLEKLEEEVMSLARRIALVSPVAISMVKRSLNKTLDLMGQKDAWDYHFAAHVSSHFTEESRELMRQLKAANEAGALGDFLAKRDAKFTPR